MSDQVIINDEFKADVVEAEEALDALRNGEVDVIIGKKYPLVVLADWVRAEMEKAATEWQATFDASPEGICIMDEDQKIVQSNEGMARLFGRKVKDMVGQYCWEVVHGTTGPIKGCPCQRMKKTCQPGSLEVVEGQRCLKLSVYPIADDKKTSTRTVHIFQDITDYKKAEDERNQLLVQLFQAQKLEAICTLAGGIAHDFNNILSAIIGYAEFIQNEVTPDSKIGKDITQVISSSKRATDLVRQILTFSRKTEGKRLPFRPHLLVKEALEMLRATLPATINLEEDVDSDCGFVLADPTSIHQIVVNLCTNARQAMSNDKGTLRVSLRDQQVRTEDIPPGEMSTPGDFVVLSVSDTGCGMDQAT
ncbi:MAG: PAS domain-containing protein, partial [Desulfobulbaceae bacterium]|nr:PAS domain-containing protein [Desulfobulbaceae bacterium]